MNCKGLLLPALLMLTSSITLAQSASSSSAIRHTKDLTSPVRKGSNTTYFELLRLVLPDLQMNSAGEATAHKTVGVRNIAEKSEATVLEGDFEIDVFEAHWIRSEGRQVLILNTDLSATNANEGTPYQGEASIMAAFTVEPAIKLLDVLDIKTDRFSGFWEQHPTFRLTSQSEAFVIYSTHSNAGESYNDLAVMFIEGDRFKTITSVFLFNTHGCGATITETPDFRALASPGRRYPGVLVRVKVTKEADGAECDQRSRGYTRYYQATYYWNRAKAEYESGSGQLAALDKFNRKRL